MLRPVNGHLLIEPLEQESFIPSEQGTYQEIGVVVASGDCGDVSPGDKVYFDSWLAAKYPNGRDFYWLVKWEDVRAIDAD